MRSTITAEADRICEHICDLLGSGPTPLGNSIDWHVDFKTGHRWNPRTYHIRPAPYPGGYDIKVPWELSRCQHFVRLGQAYWITADEKYALEFVKQVENWVANNRWCRGVNWSSTMDVAIRVVNWLWGYHFFKESPSLSDEFRLSLYRNLLVHGRHIWRNLENKGRVVNNHYLSDLVGLIYLGILCPEFKEAAKWREFGLRKLWKELFKQVYPDGVSFEGSIAYHRLATELFLSPVILCRLNSISVPDEVMARLEKMLEFVMHYTKPDGTVPSIGDADNGRLYRLKTWNPVEWEWTDHRYLLAIGAVIYGRKDFARAPGDQWEDALWLLGKRTMDFKRDLERKELLPLELESRIFPIGGVYIMRHVDSYLIVDAGLNGQNGNGGHAHNDALGFEVSGFGENWIVDPGTFIYTMDYKQRNLFRSTSFHNVVMVNNTEINRMDERRLFSLREDAKPVVKDWYQSDDVNCLIAEHSGYKRLSPPLTHKRAFALIKSTSLFLIWDHLQSTKQHSIDVFFHLGPHTEIQKVTATSLHLVSTRFEDIGFLLMAARFPPGLAVHIEDGWISPAYGCKSRAPVARFHIEGEMPMDLIWVMVPFRKTSSPAIDWVKSCVDNWATSFILLRD